MWICKTTTMTLDGTLGPRARGTQSGGGLGQKERRRIPREATVKPGGYFYPSCMATEEARLCLRDRTKFDGSTGGTGTGRTWRGRKDAVTRTRGRQTLLTYSGCHTELERWYLDFGLEWSFKTDRGTTRLPAGPGDPWDGRFKP